MRTQIDGSEGAPVYRQIADSIKHQVALGVLEQGERLPTIRQLAENWQVDRNTALRAYRVLDREGVISLEHGRGTFVRATAHHPQVTRHRRARLELLMDESIGQALSLGYAPDEIQAAFQELMTGWMRARKRGGGFDHATSSQERRS